MTAPVGAIRATRGARRRGATDGATASVRRTRRSGKDNRLAYLMLAPLVIMLSIFVIWPLVYSGYLSFFNWSFYQESEFVGWRNFESVLTDRAFLESVFRGLRFALMVVPAMLVIAFLFASLVKSMGRRSASLLKVSIYIPTVISGVIASVIFGLIYQYSGGVANWVIGWFGIEAQAWLGDIRTSLASIAVPAVWLGLGLTALIMLAGLLDIPESYYEAAELEGANWFHRSWYITLPLMKNIILYLLITGFTAAIQQFELPLVMTGGGPLSSTMLPNLYIFDHFRNDVFVGFSIAAALLLFVVLGSISAVIFRLLNSEKAVDG